MTRRHTWLGLSLGLLVGQAAADGLDDARLAIRENRLEAAQLALQQVLVATPGDEQARLLLAKVLSWTGQYQAALQRYEALLAQEPGNTDYRFGRAQVLVWSGQPQAALPDIEFVCTRQPDDADAARLHIQALVLLKRPEALQRALQLQDQAAQRFPHLSWQVAQKEKPLVDELDRNFGAGYATHVTLTMGHESLSRGLPQGQSRQWLIEHRLAPRTVAYASVQSTRRFELTDTQFQLGAYAPLPLHATLNVEAATSGTHHMAPRSTVMASVQWPLVNGWYASLGARTSQYNRGRSEQTQAVVESYFGDFRLAYTNSLARADGGLTHGHRLQLSRYYREVSYISVTAGSGQESDVQGSRRVVLDVRSVTLHGRHWFEKDWAWQWSLGRQRITGGYSTTSLGLALRHAF